MCTPYPFKSGVRKTGNISSLLLINTQTSLKKALYDNIQGKVTTPYKAQGTYLICGNCTKFK